MKQLFPYGKPVTGKDLVDREDIIQKIIYETSGGQSVIIASPRRYGKSSVILEALNRMKNQGKLTAYVDLFEVSSLREFSEKIIEAVISNETPISGKILRMIKNSFQEFIKNLEFRHIWQNNEIVLSLGRGDISEISLLNDALDFPQIFAQRKKRHLIFAIDEFANLDVWNGSILKKMRAKFQRHNMVTYIFSGSQESLMTKLFTDRAEAFYGFGKSLELEPIPENMLVDYIKETYNKGGFKIDKKVALVLVKKSQCHPHYTKLLAQAVLDSLSPRKEEIDTKDIKNGLKRLLSITRGDMDTQWESLLKSPLKRQVIKLLAKKNASLYAKNSIPNVDKSQIYFALSDLERRGFIKKVGRGKYIFTNPFFGDYIRDIEGG
jgi:hypothetical protein